MEITCHENLFAEDFARERERLLGALGALTEGGVIEGIEHIGGTSMPGLRSRPCIDVGLAIWPFPLDAERQAKLEALGYSPTDACESPPEQRLLRSDDGFQLLLTEAGSERWTEYRLLRDYLRCTAGARDELSSRKAELAAMGIGGPERENGKSRLFADALDSARAWYVAHGGFAPIEAVAAELAALPCAWYISSGWALDLFLGRVTRVHHDIDVAVARRDQLVVQAHMTGRGWKWVTPLDGRLEPWPVQMRLELPRHQAHAHRSGDFIDFLISEIDNGVWRFRRNPSIIRSVDRMVCRTDTGIAYLAPEIALLYKSSKSGEGRTKDREDFAKVHPLLEPERRAWLCWALTVIEPTHPWISVLT